jgi:hypothetical protein
MLMPTYFVLKKHTIKMLRRENSLSLLLLSKHNVKSLAFIVFYQIYFKS